MHGHAIYNDADRLAFAASVLACLRSMCGGPTVRGTPAWHAGSSGAAEEEQTRRSVRGPDWAPVEPSGGKQTGREPALNGGLKRPPSRAEPPLHLRRQADGHHHVARGGAHLLELGRREAALVAQLLDELRGGLDQNCENAWAHRTPDRQRHAAREERLQQGKSGHQPQRTMRGFLSSGICDSASGTLTGPFSGLGRLGGRSPAGPPASAASGADAGAACCRAGCSARCGAARSPWCCGGRSVAARCGVLQP